jgi:hypothetical protein
MRIQNQVDKMESFVKDAMKEAMDVVADDGFHREFTSDFCTRVETVLMKLVEINALLRRGDD